MISGYAFVYQNVFGMDDLDFVSFSKAFYSFNFLYFFGDNFILKDILAEEDRKGMIVVNAICGTQNTGVTGLDSCLYATMGAFSRTSLTEAMKGLPSTNRRLNPAAALVNNLFIWNVVAMTRENIGGDLAEELFVNAFTERKIMGINWIVTIKQDLVLDTDMYMFAEPKFLGKFFVLEDTTMHIERKAYMLSFFSYEEIGSAIGNVAACARADFSGGNISGNDLWRY
jgi:hypothetical protein